MPFLDERKLVTKFLLFVPGRALLFVFLFSLDNLKIIPLTAEEVIGKNHISVFPGT